jgi:hypothetical protein
MAPYFYHVHTLSDYSLTRSDSLEFAWHPSISGYYHFVMTFSPNASKGLSLNAIAHPMAMVLCQICRAQQL